jgi:LmbE family N-acetylglucosaminyl deacetylase
MMHQVIKAASRVLVLAPHTDDAELGCGGTIARLLRSGVEVHLAAFSTCEDSLPPGAHATQLRDEFMEAMAVFGVPEKNLSVFGFRVRHLSSHRQEVLEEIVKLRKQVDPDVVFLPSGSDLHQDHQVLYSEGIRAFKERTVWGYELPWNHIRFSAQAFVTLERSDLETKWEALKAYKSQLELKRPYFSWEFIEGLARIRGVQVKAEYAEAFEVVRVKW